MTQLDERSAVYATPDEQRVPLDLRETLKARVAHLEGMVTVALDELRRLQEQLEAREGDHK